MPELHAINIIAEPGLENRFYQPGSDFSTENHRRLSTKMEDF